MFAQNCYTLTARRCSLSEFIAPYTQSHCVGNQDLRRIPIYSYTEAAKATGVPSSTLRAWRRGQFYDTENGVAFFEPVLSEKSTAYGSMSFLDIIEAHVLRALRRFHNIPLKNIREAITIAEKELGIPHLLISQELCTSSRKLYLDKVTTLLELSSSRQYAMRSVLAQYLKRVVFDTHGVPREYFPFGKSPTTTDKTLISLSPYLAFGMPVLRMHGVTTKVVFCRLEAGESPQEVMDDYGLTKDELEEAILYESVVA